MGNLLIDKDDKDTAAIIVKNIYKAFRIPHEKHSSLKSAALNILKKKTYTSVVTAKNISFEVKKGEFLGIIGRNGSGKSTLLKMLAGIYKPDSGEVVINGKLSPFLELGVGFNPELTARENVYLGGSILGLSKAEIDSKLSDIIKFAELEEFIDMKFKNFSSGMQVRLAFALSINAHAEILLMDEVLAVGDTNFQAKCLREFRNYKKLGKTVVLVTHDINVVQRYCDRAILLSKGIIIKQGPPQIVCDTYSRKNIEDKELRSVYELAKKSSTKEVKFTKYTLLDSFGKKTNSYRVGDKFHLMTQFNNFAKNGVVNINVAIRDALDDRLLLSYSTLADDFTLGKKNTISLVIDSIPLLRGSYYCNIAAFRESEEDRYDYVPEAVKFIVSSRDHKDLLYNGSVYAKHVWK